MNKPAVNCPTRCVSETESVGKSSGDVFVIWLKVQSGLPRVCSFAPKS